MFSDMYTLNWVFSFEIACVVHATIIRYATLVFCYEKILEYYNPWLLQGTYSHHLWVTDGYIYNDPHGGDAVSSAAASSVPPIISVVLASPANWATN